MYNVSILGLITPSRIFIYFFRNHISVAIQLHTFFSATWHKKNENSGGQWMSRGGKEKFSLSLSPSPPLLPPLFSYVGMSALWFIYTHTHTHTLNKYISFMHHYILLYVTLFLPRDTLCSCLLEIVLQCSCVPMKRERKHILQLLQEITLCTRISTWISKCFICSIHTSQSISIIIIMVTMVNAMYRVKHVWHTYARTSCVKKCHICMRIGSRTCMHDDESLKTISNSEIRAIHPSASSSI